MRIVTIILCGLCYLAAERAAGRTAMNNDGHYVTTATDSHAATLHRHRGHAHRSAAHATEHHTRMIQTSTEAGTVTVDPSFAPKIVGLVSAIKSEHGYLPSKLHCFSRAKSHVKNSRHKIGRACDFDQSGWGRTAKAMYHVSLIVARFGLRDGCEFRDWGHVDDGPHLPLRRVLHNCGEAYARAIYPLLEISGRRTLERRHARRR